MSETSLNGLLGAFKIRPSIETVALDKSGFMGMQKMPIERERNQLQFVLKDNPFHFWSSSVGRGHGRTYPDNNDNIISALSLDASRSSLR